MVALTTAAGGVASAIIIGGKEDLSQSGTAFVSEAFERGVNSFCKSHLPVAAGVHHAAPSVVNHQTLHCLHPAHLDGHAVSIAARS
jgi:hypothetical protein|eukprot:COSAG02_NODE_597_length_19775_cov_28.914312_4_plen_86_part_00